MVLVAGAEEGSEGSVRLQSESGEKGEAAGWAGEWEARLVTLIKLRWCLSVIESRKHVGTTNLTDSCL